MQIDISKIIKERVGDIQILQMKLEKEKISLTVRFSNGRKRIVKLNRFVDVIKWAFCVGIFAGEGTKRGGRGFPFEFTNSNPKRLQAMIKFLEDLGVGKEEIKVRLQIRCSEKEIKEGKIKKLEEFWSQFLKIPRSQFEKTNVRISNRPSKSKFGTIRLRVNSNFLAKLFIEWEKFIIGG